MGAKSAATSSFFGERGHWPLQGRAGTWHACMHIKDFLNDYIFYTIPVTTLQISMNNVYYVLYLIYLYLL